MKRFVKVALFSLVLKIIQILWTFVRVWKGTERCTWFSGFLWFHVVWLQTQMPVAEFPPPTQLSVEVLPLLQFNLRLCGILVIHQPAKTSFASLKIIYLVYQSPSLLLQRLLQLPEKHRSSLTWKNLLIRWVFTIWLNCLLSLLSLPSRPGLPKRVLGGEGVGEWRHLWAPWVNDEGTSVMATSSNWPWGHWSNRRYSTAETGQWMMCNGWSDECNEGGGEEELKRENKKKRWEK